MISFQSYVGSAYSSHPVRWIETPEAARSRYVAEQIPEAPVSKVADPDLGKPKSASGDVLDLSAEALKAIDLLNAAANGHFPVGNNFANHVNAGTETGATQPTASSSEASESNGSEPARDAFAGQTTSEQTTVAETAVAVNTNRGSEVQTNAIERPAAERPGNESSRAERSREERTATSGETTLREKKTSNLAADGELTPEQQKQLAELKARDQEVRVHEMAHVLAGGQYVTSGPSYEYEIGPDGNGYAVSGSVGIDTGAVAGDPQATIEKMQTVVAAAMAPAQPSSQDHKVAAAARQAESRARAELSQMRAEEMQSSVTANTEDESAMSSTAQAADSRLQPAGFGVIRTADRVAEHTLAAPPSKQTGEEEANGNLIANGVSAQISSAQSEVAPKAEAEDAVMSSLVKTQPKAVADFNPGSSYSAQSVMSQASMTLASPRFSAFA